jgi:cation/acetate symporter
MDALPQWIYTYGQIGLVKVCGVDATTLDAIRQACVAAGSGDNILALGDLKLDNDAIVISMPEIAGLPYVISGLVAAGGLAAALSTADGLLLAIANALSHDIYYRMLDPNAPTARRLVVARILLVGVAVIGAYTASFRPADIVAMVAWAFSLAAGGLFPALVLGIWWKRTTSAGAIWGIIVGFGVTLLYLVVTRYYPAFGVNYLGMSSLLNPVTGAPVVDVAAAIAGDPAEAYKTLASKVGWFNINNISSAIFGLPLGTAVMVVVSLLTPAPGREMQDFIDEVRRPRGETLMKEKAA